MSGDKMFKYRYRSPLNTPQFRGSRPRQYTRTEESGMIIERDVRVPTRFGYDLFIDIYRPVDESLRSPPIIAWTPYGKSDPAPLHKIYPTCGVEEGWMSDYTIFEAPDPVYWVSKGYVVINCDVPGLWFASTDAHFCAPEEAEAFYDLIEWAGVQVWSNGKVGLSGVSYLAVSQWRVAELNPPHLAAINPVEGWTDLYREVVQHGGIPDTYFWPYIQVRWGASDHRVEDLWAEGVEHPLWDEYWESKAAKLENIKVPAYIVASWSDHGLHTRGTLEGFKKISSENKWLEVHGRKKWHYYYRPDFVERQTEFFDRYLKDDTSAWQDQPRVSYEVRERYNEGSIRAASDWPLPDTQYVRLYLDAKSSALTVTAPTEESSVSYDSLDEQGQAVFSIKFATDTSLVGHMKLKLFASTKDTNDMDLFVAIEKLDCDGNKVCFAHYATFENGPVGLGWIRASHRELRADSTEFQPVLSHRKEQKLDFNEVVELDVEILPSGTHFASGESLKLVIKGRDVVYNPKPMVTLHHENTVNLGEHTLYTGGALASYLLLPLIESED